MSKVNFAHVDLSGSLKEPVTPVGSLSAGVEPFALKEYQRQCLVDLEAYIPSKGFGAGEIGVMMAGRGTGKSQMAHYAAIFNSIFTPVPLSEIKVSTGKIYGQPYHTLQPIGGSWKEMENWCTETFGPGSTDLWEGSRNSHVPNPGERWYMNNSKFWFRDVKDRDWFIMRWNS
jgi:hypothetical protein